jgi:hypothetical protein
VNFTDAFMNSASMSPWSAPIMACVSAIAGPPLHDARSVQSRCSNTCRDRRASYCWVKCPAHPPQCRPGTPRTQGP